MRTLLVFSNKRSGHHAIINWIGTNMEQGVNFHNDLYWRDFIKGRYNYIGKHKDKKYGRGATGCLIYNFENVNINQHENILKSPLIRGYDKTLIPLRDVYNMTASSIKSTRGEKDDYIRKLVDRWKEYCYEILGETSYADNKMFINYNTWFVDREYRDIVGQALGFVNQDKGIHNVSRYGGGSSFDKVNAHDARKMDVLNRWKQYYDHRLFQKYITDEVDELNKRVFGFNLNDLRNGYY